MELTSSFTLKDGVLHYDNLTPTEQSVYHYLKRHFGHVAIYPVVLYKRRLYRPAMLLTFEEYPKLKIFVEVDEEYHWKKDVKLEALRMHNIINSTTTEWTYMIRFNPSQYVVEEGFYNSLCLESRLKTIYNRVRQILYQSKFHQKGMVPMEQRVSYLFYPEHRANRLALEMFLIE